MSNWKLDGNRKLTELLFYERDIIVVILYQDDIQRANILNSLKTKLVGSISQSTLWGIKLFNDNLVRFVPIQQSQINTRGVTISLLLFPDSIEYNVRQEITRELYPQMIRDGGITGTIHI